MESNSVAHVKYDETLYGCFGCKRRSYQILSTDVTYETTPVQFEAVYCVMEKWYSNEN